jgi:N-methylhydantoinase A/oxoprolinase/acetone carboxylase beta subunit
VLSAVGLLTSPRQRDLVRSWPWPLDHAGVGDALRRLGRKVAELVGDGAEVTTAVDCRYVGQSHELTVATPADFHEAHRSRNGFARPDEPVEVVALRATAALPPAGSVADLAAVVRAAAAGPTAVAEPDCSIWIPAGWVAEPAEAGALVLRRSAS